jgi:hypothetical protein
MTKFLNKKNKNYKQGIYNPKNPKKYTGSLPIIYRSGLELKSFRYLDNNPNVLTWGSESVIIPYQSPTDGQIHRYFVDLVATLKMKNGEFKKLLIEVKPEKQTKPPIITSKKKQSTMLYEKYQWAINQAKWDAAKAWCNKKNYLFIILNEKHLN